MSQPFVEIALLPIAIVVAAVLFCVMISRRVRQSIVRLTRFKLRTLMIATTLASVVFAIFKANPELVKCLVALQGYGCFEAMTNGALFTAFAFGAPVLGLVLFDNWRYERESRRERKERLQNTLTVASVDRTAQR